MMPSNKKKIKCVWGIHFDAVFKYGSLCTGLIADIGGKM
jgi:hypothetical protein